MDIKRIEGLKIVTDCGMPSNELAHIEKEKKEAYNKAIDDVLKIVRLENVSESAGYIEDYDSNFIYCLLKKERTMNKELKYPIYALNEEQKNLVTKGRMIEFFHETGAIIFNV